MNKLLCIVGPTGTGKTAKALRLGSQEPSILVSADSRQVYRGMDIVTGKDHPADISIFGIDIVDPDESCSVSVWYNAVIPYIAKAWEEGKLPIIVGGTGLYIKAITEGIETMQIPFDQPLRNKLLPLSILELQEILSNLNQVKFNSMNHSDQNNPRRLIRAIEILKSNNQVSMKHTNSDFKIIGIRPPTLDIYMEMIKARVISRIDKGAIEETKLLLSKYDKTLPSMSAIGYKSIINYIEGTISKEQMIKNWIAGELSYAKRQMTWFLKQPIIWYDVEK